MWTPLRTWLGKTTPHSLQAAVAFSLMPSLYALQTGPVSLFHPLKATLEQTQPLVFNHAKAFLRQKSCTSLNNGGTLWVVPRLPTITLDCSGPHDFSVILWFLRIWASPLMQSAFHNFPPLLVCVFGLRELGILQKLPIDSKESWLPFIDSKESWSQKMPPRYDRT